MKKNVEITKQLGLLKINHKRIIPIEQVDDYPDNKVMVICTGSQGESNAALMRYAMKTHRSFRIKKGDTVMFSNSIIPGNEASISKVKDLLVRQGAIIKDYKMLDIHTGGHAHHYDMLLMLNLIRPKYFVPIEQAYISRIAGANIAASWGIKKENIFLPGNGQVLELLQDKIQVVKTKIPTDYVLVDGLSHGDIGNVVIKDRQQLAKEGMIVIIVPIDRNTETLARPPEILSRGFIYMKSSLKLLDEVKEQVKHIIMDNQNGQHSVNWFYVQGEIKEQITDLLFKRTKRNPMVLPVVFEV